MRFNVRIICLVLIAISALTLTGSAQTKDDKTLAPYFFVQGDPNLDHLQRHPCSNRRLRRHAADVKVTQTYRNEGSRPINARYVFPASTRAAVYAMRMRIGDQVIVAKIKAGTSETRIRQGQAGRKERVAPGAEQAERVFDESR